MRTRPVKIKCDCCGRRHDLRVVSPGTCARCCDMQATPEVSVSDFLATIENAGVRASYASYLNRVARLLGFQSREDASWEDVTQSTVDHLAKTELPAKLASSVRSAFKALAAFAADLPKPKTCGRITVPPAYVEVLGGGLVRDGVNLVFHPASKGEDKPFVVPTAIDDFELLIGVPAA